MRFSSRALRAASLPNVKLGGVETLERRQRSTIQPIGHYLASAANARWGAGHASGPIQVITAAPPSGGSVPPAAR